MNERTFRKLLAKYDPDWRDREVLARGSEALEIYVTSREQGNDHRWALMCACQQAPGANTDREFFAGRHTLAKQFDGNEAQLNEIVAAARRKGYNPSPSDVYDSTLARDLGDPAAFISASGGRTQLRRTCEARGIGRQPENPIPAGRLADDLIAEEVEKRIAANPDLARTDIRDLVADVRDKHEFTDAKRAPLTGGPIKFRKPARKAKLRRK